MLVSIIITSYNYEAYLAQAIDSALAQNYSPLEVFAIDDGSTDNSPNIIRSYGDRVHAVFKRNEGQRTCYNLGWKMARGDIVMFLDSDDVLLPDAAARSVAALQQPGAVKAQFLLTAVDKDLRPTGGFMPTYGLRDAANIPRDIALWGYYLSPPSSGNAFRKDFLDKIMPMPKKDFGNYYLPPDGYVAALAGLAGGVVSIHEPLGLYRFHGKNESDAGKVETVEKLRGLFMYDYIRETHQIEWASKFGFLCRFDRSRFHPTVCKKRFLAYRLEPKGHPVKQDNYLRLLASGLWGTVRFPYLTLRKRIFIFCGFLFIAVMPRAVLRNMIGAIAKPQERKGVLQLLRVGA